MNSDQWHRLDTALAAALELPPASRDAALVSALDGDPALLQEARHLLEVESEADRFFLRAAPVVAPNLLVGPWRLVRELGRGGMGVVWLAERAVGDTGMRAAIKFLDTPFAAPEMRRRFAEEKRLLARLNHPHIARILDAGLDAHPLPNFVLEFVDGVPLTSFTSSLSPAACLPLLIQIAHAVQHAHANLVIHRDLKPANILVTAAGESKLLDFGLARLAAPSAVNTATIFRALSLDYASPEQIRGEEVTTATDIYSLGVVFFEALTAQRARRWSTKPIAQAVSDAGQFRLPPPPILPIDLRAVLDKATDPDPSLRYASAAAFATDLENVLLQRPVEARPRTALYTLQRFVARNRIPVSLAVTALLTFSALGGYAIRAGLHAEASRAIADTRLQQVLAANRETSQALARAESQSRFAESQRQLAASRQRDVLEMSFATLTETYRELRELPGSTATRARLLTGTLQRLKRLQDAGDDDRNLLLLIADAHGRLAEVLGGKNENLGDPQAAQQHLNSQIRILDALRARFPSDDEITRIWADAAVALWWQLPSAQRTPNAPALLRLEPVWNRLLASSPRNPAVLRAAGSYYFSRSMSVGLPPTAKIQFLEKAAALWASEEALTGGGEIVWRNLALANKYIAGAYIALPQSPRQLHHAELARAFDQKRLDRNPANSQARMDLSFGLTALADYHYTRKDFSAATPFYRQALQIRVSLLATEPANQQYRRSIAYPARNAAWSAWQSADFAGLATDLDAFRQYRPDTKADQSQVEFLTGELAHHRGHLAEACAAWRRAEASQPDPVLASRLAERLLLCTPKP